MARTDWCSHGKCTLCHHLGFTADGREVRCSCECHVDKADAA